MEISPPEVLSNVSAIHDEGEARTQKAGSSNHQAKAGVSFGGGWKASPLPSLV